MKRLLTILTFLFPVLLFGQRNKIDFKVNIKPESRFKLDSTYTNYYIFEDNDTMFFTKTSTVIDCNYLQTIDRSHNKCRILVNKKPGHGKIKIYFFSENGKTKQLYSGTLDSGFFKTGIYSIYSTPNRLLAAGQYLNNWKFGFWTTYFQNGKIETISQYMTGADEPVKEWEFDQNGQLINFIDEEEKIVKRMEEKNVR